MLTPSISAIICTYNRDTYVGAAIDSILAQDLPEFEVILVDNCSTDRTKAIAQERLSDPRFKYFYESQLGLSAARNRGFKEAKGDILVYLDDDAVASPGWLRAIYQAYKNNEKLAIAGGKTTLIWPPNTPRPNWLSRDASGVLGLYDLGDAPLSITRPDRSPIGANYSIRRDILEAIGGFNVNLGRVGKNLVSNEELFMTEQVLKQGWMVMYLPDAAAGHNVIPERITPNWFLKRSWGQGISESYRDQLANRSALTQFGNGGERLLRGLYKSLKYFGSPEQRFENFLYAYGQIAYLKTSIRGMLFGKISAE
ncbi:glycosyltransferase family 2 protein [Spirulina sp. 06S082]|uniref:glycosyltransferase family 2 protein n=1 Tax=Spirulina sp. 06S082 TaxID=3110248 RepID=UPI002B21E16E|nr:glycosyltransferase family 2 protein [Spirulina sp. 06S082]MEA5469538.1 glycosyltransferase family 2 protein [Spirulina sp. 06S082]